MAFPKQRSKYGNQKVYVDGYEFDSRKESRRYIYLKQRQKAGEITGLELQVSFELVPALYEKSADVYTKGPKKGKQKPGKCIERSVTYVADFVYTEIEKRPDGRTVAGAMVAEDVKGMKTKEYIIKRKLFRWLYGDRYEFREV